MARASTRRDARGARSDASRRRATTRDDAASTNLFVPLAVVGAVAFALLRRALGRGGAPATTRKTPTKAPSSASRAATAALPRHARSNNKKNRARRAGKRELAEARRREEDVARAKSEAKARKGNDVPKVRAADDDAGARSREDWTTRDANRDANGRADGPTDDDDDDDGARRRRIRTSSAVRPVRRLPRRRTSRRPRGRTISTLAARAARNARRVSNPQRV